MTNFSLTDLPFLRFPYPELTLDNHFINFGVEGIGTQTLTIFELDELGNTLKQHSHSLTGGFAFLHDMLVTDNYYIFLQHPFKVQGLPFLLGFKTIEQCLDFDPKQSTKIILISRHGNYDLEILETESFFGFHHGNAWEKDEKIYLESICSHSFPQKQQAELALEEMDFDQLPKGELWELELNLAQKTVTHRKIEERGCEFPSINPMWIGKENRYVYMSACDSLTENGPLQAILKLDKEAGEKQLWSVAPQGFPSEPIFVPHPSGTKEDDGWLISLVYDAATHRSYVVILDAQDLNQVIAKLYLEHHIPHGFHGNWTSEIFI